KFDRAFHKPFGRAISPDDARIVEVARFLGERAALRGRDLAKNDRITGRLRRACARAAQGPAAHVRIVGEAAEKREYEVMPDLVQFERRPVMLGEFTRLHRPLHGRPAQKKPPREFPRRLCVNNRKEASVLGRPGSDLLFQVLRLSTIGAGEFNGRVRDGIGYGLPAKTTRPAKDGHDKLAFHHSGEWPLKMRDDQALTSD